MKRLLLLTVAIAALVLAAATAPVLAHHGRPSDCILVKGEWYCKIKVCHIKINQRVVAPRIETRSDGTTVVVIEVPKDEEPKETKTHDDNGHGNDPGKVDPSNPGKSKR